MQGLLCLGEHRSVGGAGLVDGLQREQDAPLRIRVEVRHRGRCKPPSRCDPGLPGGTLTLAQCEDAEPRGDEGPDPEGHDERSEPGDRAPLERRLVLVPLPLLGLGALPLGQACGEVLPLQGSEEHARRRHPLVCLIEAAA